MLSLRLPASTAWLSIRNRLCCGLAVAAAVTASEAGANERPLGDGACPARALVDAEFRTSALAALDRLIVHAPGQPAHGAVMAHHSAGHIDTQGRAWHQVSAYQVNLGLIGALSVAPRLLPVVADWLRWQARHSAASGPTRGVVLDHWLRAGDLEESTCPSGIARRLCGEVDAFDSTAASTLLMADAYLGRGGDVMFLREPTMRRALEDAAAALTALQSEDGMTLAKPTHPVVYTMDLVEVVAGWRAWARLQRDAYSQPQSAKTSLENATRAEAALNRRLWDPGAGAWRVNLGSGPARFDRWYPDTMVQSWPLLWGVGGGPPGRAVNAWRQAIANWERKPHWAQVNADPDGFWWPSVAVAALCTGNEAGAREWVARARRHWLDRRAPFAWPFQIGDLLWLLWLAEPETAGAPQRPVS